MDAEEARTIGRLARQIRYARRKSLRVIAGLAGMSTTTLHRIETGQRALDSRSEIRALANALQVAPSELTRMDVPAPGNGATDLAVEAVRVALMAVNHGYPGGQVLPVEVLRDRVGAVIGAGCTGNQELTGHALPTLIRDLYTTIAAGRDVAKLLGLAALLHTPSRRPKAWIHGCTRTDRARRRTGSTTAARWLVGGHATKMP